MVKAGKIPYLKSGRRLRFNLNQVLDALKKKSLTIPKSELAEERPKILSIGFPHYFSMAAQSCLLPSV